MQHDERVLKSGFSGDGKRIATLTTANQVRLWDWQAQSRVSRPLEVTPTTLNPRGFGAESGMIYVVRSD